VIKTILAGLVLAAICFGTAQSAPVSKHVQNHCVQDYKKYCHEWGIETKELTNCMHRHGDRLTNACIAALVQAGEVSQAEVNRRKEAAAKM
jgi:phosphosulfolactate synthase (CoM biosynthesis protein A)